MDTEAKKAVLVNILNASYSLMSRVRTPDDKTDYYFIINEGKKEFDFNNLNFTGTEEEINEKWNKLYDFVVEQNKVGVEIKVGKNFLLKIFDFSPEVKLFIADKESALELSKGETADFSDMK